jgi:methyl-accepting chemotaxis protein
MGFFYWMREVLETLLAIKEGIDNLNAKGDQIMATLDDVQAALDKLVADVTAAIAEIKDLAAQLAAAAGDPIKTQAILDEINQTATDLEAVLPVPVPPPTP